MPMIRRCLFAGKISDLSDDAHSIARLSRLRKVRHRIPAVPQQSCCLECDESTTFESEIELNTRDPLISVGKSLSKIDSLGAPHMRDDRSRFVCLTEGALPLILDSGEESLAYDADDSKLRSTKMVEALSDVAHNIGRLSRFLKVRRRIPALPQRSSHLECDESSISDSESSQAELSARDPLIPVGKSLSKNDSLGAPHMRDDRSKVACLSEGALPLILDSDEEPLVLDADDSKLPTTKLVKALPDDAHDGGKLSRFLKGRRHIPAVPEQSFDLETDASSASDSEFSQGEPSDGDLLQPDGRPLSKMDCVTCHASGSRIHNRLGAQRMYDDRSQFECLTEGALPLILDSGEQPLVHGADDTKLHSAEMVDELCEDAHSIGRLSKFRTVRHRIPAVPQQSHESGSHTTQDGDSNSACLLDVNLSFGVDSGDQPLVQTTDKTSAPSAEMRDIPSDDEDLSRFRNLRRRNQTAPNVNVVLDTFVDEPGSSTYDRLAAQKSCDDSSQLIFFTEESLPILLGSGEQPLVPDTDDTKMRSGGMRTKSSDVAHRSDMHLKFLGALDRIPTIPKVNVILGDDLPGVSNSRTNGSVGAQRRYDGRSQFVCRTDDASPPAIPKVNVILGDELPDVSSSRTNGSVGAQRNCDGRSQFVCRTDDASPLILELREQPLAHDTDATKLSSAGMNEKSSSGASGIGRLARFLKTRHRHRTRAVPKQCSEIDNAVNVAKKDILAKITEFDQKKKLGGPMPEADTLISNPGVVAAVGCCDGGQLVRKAPSMAHKALNEISSVASRMIME